MLAPASGCYSEQFEWAARCWQLQRAASGSERCSEITFDGTHFTKHEEDPNYLAPKPPPPMRQLTLHEETLTPVHVFEPVVQERQVDSQPSQSEERKRRTVTHHTRAPGLWQNTKVLAALTMLQAWRQGDGVRRCLKGVSARAVCPTWVPDRVQEALFSDTPEATPPMRQLTKPLARGRVWCETTLHSPFW